MSVLEKILNMRFFEPWRRGQSDADDIWADANLELFITATCNQKCEYCYLVRHDELFPPELRKPENIKKNLRIFLDWCLEQGFSFNQVDFFSGEIWQTPFGWDILGIFLEYLQKGLKVRIVMIPSNVSFLMSDEATNHIKNFIDDYAACGTWLQFSGSVDGGKLDTLTRKGNTEDITATKNSDEFYDKFFTFFKHYNYLFHPMVAQENVEYWIENFEWWKEKCRQYGYNPYTDIMMLEVRNDGWDEGSINHFLNFLDYLIDDCLKNEFGGDVKSFTNYLFLTDMHNNICSGGYLNFGMTPARNFNGCTASEQFTVRLGDLAIPCCHRTAYNNLLFGRFKTENDKIVGIEENNPQLASCVLLQNSTLCTPGCDTCDYNYFCMRGCYGSQYEAEKDPLMPIKSVCDMFRAKHNFLIKKYESLGVIDELKKIPVTNPRYNEIQEILRQIERIRGGVEWK